MTRVGRAEVMDKQTRSAISSLRNDIGSLRAEIHHIRDELGGEIREGDAQTRRHMDVLFESLRDDIRILADGLVALDAKVESIRR